MKIIATSDLHGNLPEIEGCDLLLICGDIVPLDKQTSKVGTKVWFTTTFESWAENLPCNKVLFIPGNHDLYLEGDRYRKTYSELFPKDNKVTFICHEYYEYDGIKLFGSPYCKIFGQWAYMRTYKELVKLFKDVPEDLDILFTHDAPFNCTDICLQGYNFDCLGSVALREAILEKQPKYALHGHLHSSQRSFESLGNTKVANVSYVNEHYYPAYEPLIINL